MVDQYTYDLVVAMARGAFKFTDLEIIAVNSVSIVGGSAKLDTSSVEVLPSKLEEKIFSAINCTPSPKEWKKNIRIETKRSISTEITKTVTSSSEVKVGIQLGDKAIQFNGDISQKNSIALQTTQLQSFSETTIEEITEQRTIPSKTALFVKTVTTKGLLKGKLTGVVQLDASISLSTSLGLGLGITISEVCSLSDPSFFTQIPSLLETNIDGYIYSEGYDRTDIVYIEQALADDDPVCAIPASPNPLSGFLHNLQRDEIFEIPGFLHSARTAPESFGESLEIRLQSDDIGDLYVWVWDQNTFGADLILEAERINAGDIVEINIAANGDGKGLISWRAVRVDSPDEERSEQDVEVSPGDRVDITTQFD